MIASYSDCTKSVFGKKYLILENKVQEYEVQIEKSSKELSKLKYSVPDYINTHPEISKLISSITSPSDKEGGEGAILVKLKKL